MWLQEEGKQEISKYMFSSKVENKINEPIPYSVPSGENIIREVVWNVTSVHQHFAVELANIGAPQ